MASPLDPHVAAPSDLQERIEAERQGRPLLVYRDGGDRQVLVDLESAGDRLTVGRRSSDEICLEWDHEVSRTHARLERIGEDWTVYDDGLSRNGTFVNGERIVRRRLAGGDTVMIGATTFAFWAPPATSQPSPTMTAQQGQLATRITPAQRRVLVALCRPFKDSTFASPPSNRQIAAELVVSVDAVKRTLRALFAAFEIDDLAQNEKRAVLAREALRRGAVVRRDL